MEVHQQSPNTNQSQNNSPQKKSKLPFHNGGAYCLSSQTLHEYYEQKCEDANKAKQEGTELVPEVQALKQDVLKNPVLKMTLKSGISNIPEGGVLHGNTLDEVFNLISSVCTQAPKLEDKKIVGLPFTAIFIDLMNNKEGQQFFSNPIVNQHLKHIFHVYARMLESPASLKYMNEEEPHGWFSSLSHKYIVWEDYYYDKQKPNWGFKNWNDFFIKPIRPEKRSLDERKNSIVHSSDSHPLYYPFEGFGQNPATNVQAQSQFWLKDNQYSLYDMFGVREEANVKELVDRHFVGGTVYQAFLDPWCYHRWHSPISGTVIKSYKVGGSYFLVNPNFITQGINHGCKSYVKSQPLLSMVSVRQIFIIKIDDGSGRCVAVIEIGMTEVSSCKPTVSEGEYVKKGDQIGYFQFGGSSLALVFDKRFQLEWNPNIFDANDDGDVDLLPVNSWLATFK